ncbi:glycosyltransferase family 1 protein [Bacteroides fragilis]|nr:glycosyltransferase family 1 protein [Bacteroides fragilis]
MKILYFFKEDDTYMTQWQRVHIFDELKHHNVNITVLNPSIYETVCQANEDLINLLRYNKDHYDLFMNCCGSDLLLPETMEALKDLSIPKLLICFDNLHAPYIHKDIAPFFDLVWLTSFETKSIFQKWGCNIIFLPYAANPYNFKNIYHRDILEVGFIGTPYGTRTLKLNQLLEHNIACRICGKLNNGSMEGKKVSNILTTIDSVKNLFSFSVGRKILQGKLLAKIKGNVELESKSEWLTISGPVSFDEMNRLYSNFALNLNILELRNTYLLKYPVYKLHLRTFEIPMCAGIQITTYNDELSSYFEEDKEIVFYRDLSELIDKCRFYLDAKKGNIRKMMRKNIRIRAEQEHTWWNRFTLIFDKLELGGKL